MVSKRERQPSGDCPSRAWKIYLRRVFLKIASARPAARSALVAAASALRAAPSALDAAALAFDAPEFALPAAA